MEERRRQFEGTEIPTGHSIWKISLPRSLKTILLLLKNVSVKRLEGLVLVFSLVFFAEVFELFEDTVEVGVTLVEIFLNALRGDQATCQSAYANKRGRPSPLASSQSNACSHPSSSSFNPSNALSNFPKRPVLTFSFISAVSLI